MEGKQIQFTLTPTHDGGSGTGQGAGVEPRREGVVSNDRWTGI
jgi:hypothetical protein